MQSDYEKTAAVLVAEVQRAVEAATAPLRREIDQLKARPAEKGEQGASGVGVAGALIDRSGNLILTLSDGTTHDLGPVVGKDGADGGQGPQGDPGERGADGKDAYAGEARGAYDPEGTYRAMDVVAFNGSEWRAKKDDPGPLPGDGWMLSASKGKRGDRGERGERGTEGKAGKDGAELIQIEIKTDADTAQLLAVRDDGQVLEADMMPVVRAIIDGIQDA